MCKGKVVFESIKKRRLNQLNLGDTKGNGEISAIRMCLAANYG